MLCRALFILYLALVLQLPALPVADAKRAEKHVQAALKMLKKGRTADATMELKVAQTLNPGRPDVPKLLETLRQGKPVDLAKWQPALMNGELQAKVDEALAQARAGYVAGDDAAAREAWRRALTLDSGNATAQDGLARLDKEAYQKDASQPFDKLVAQLYLNGLHAARKSRLAEAKAKLDEALALNPDQAQVKALLAEVAEGAQFEAGQKEAEQAAKEGNGFLKNNDYLKAAQAFKRALAAKPDHEGALAGQAKVTAATAGQVAELLAKADKAVKEQKLADAERLYALAATLDPKNAAALEGQSKANRSMQQAGMTTAQRKEADRLYNQGVEAWQGGDLAGGAARFREALQLAPADAEAQKALNMVLMQLEERSNKDRKDAQRLLGEGRRLEKKGAPEEALKRYERALVKDKANLEADEAVKRLKKDLGKG